MFLLFFQELATQLFGGRASVKATAVASASARVLQPSQASGKIVATSSVRSSITSRAVVSSFSVQLFSASASVSIAPSQ